MSLTFKKNTMANPAKLDIPKILGKDAEYLLNHKSKTISKDHIHLPTSDFIDRIFIQSNRNAQVIRSLGALFDHGRLAGTGFLSILPIDQGIEHSAGASFAKNQIYFDPENIIKLAIAGGCNAVATTFGNIAFMSKKYAHKIPFIVKINHNELLTYPNKFDQIMFGSVRDAWNLGAVAVGATIYFGSDKKLVLADVKKRGKIEYFHYKEAVYLSRFRQGKFKKMIKDGRIIWEFRLHLKSNTAIRDHGSGFRTARRNILDIYKNKRKIL